MALENLAYTSEQLKNDLTEFADKAREFPGRVREGVEAASREFQQGIRRTKEAATDIVDDARLGIRKKPITTVAVTALVGFALGMIVGSVFRSRR
jgi:ElaB/YqjD/DUF883 family membrane-anchored ribosome-binding protein